MKFPVELILIACIFTIAGCDYGRESRIVTQINKDLKIQLSQQPELLFYENFGWAEEGGYISLIQLSFKNCTKVNSTLDSITRIDTNSTYYEKFLDQGIKPETVHYKWVEDGYLDYREYALESSSCILYIQVHNE